MSARFSLPAGAHPKWLRARLSEARHGDWLDGPFLHGKVSGDHDTVGDLVAALAKLAPVATTTFLEVSGTTDVTVLGCLDDGADEDRYHQDLATAVRLAHDVGGRGHALFVPFAGSTTLSSTGPSTRAIRWTISEPEIRE